MLIVLPYHTSNKIAENLQPSQHAMLLMQNTTLESLCFDSALLPVSFDVKMLRCNNDCLDSSFIIFLITTPS